MVYCLLTWVYHSDQSAQRLGPPAAVELRVDVQTEDVVGVVTKFLLYQHLDELHPSSRDLLPTLGAGYRTHRQLEGHKEVESLDIKHPEKML